MLSGSPDPASDRCPEGMESKSEDAVCMGIKENSMEPVLHGRILWIPVDSEAGIRAQTLLLRSSSGEHFLIPPRGDFVPASSQLETPHECWVWNRFLTLLQM